MNHHNTIEMPTMKMPRRSRTETTDPPLPSSPIITGIQAVEIGQAQSEQALQLILCTVGSTGEDHWVNRVTQSVG